jgi:hypothetical protein
MSSLRKIKIVEYLSEKKKEKKSRMASKLTWESINSSEKELFFLKGIRKTPSELHQET